MKNRSENSFVLLASCFQLRILAALSMWLVAFVAEASSIDSLRMETINGKQFIIHQVDAKETLYSISRRYRVPVTLLAEENPGAGSGLTIGQQLKVPYIHSIKPRAENGNTIHKVAQKETLFSISKMFDISIDDLKSWNNLKDNSLNIGQDLIVRKKLVAETKIPDTKIPDAKKLKGVHTVTDKETLFSISKMYGASVQQLKDWNKLATDDVKPGQTLFVLPPVTTNETFQTEVKQNQVTKAAPEIKISETIIGSEEVHEKGMATILEGTDGNRKYLAQHKTAKTGTIMKVRNSANNQEVFVRVIAPLTTTDETLVKISKSAYDKLGAIDSRFAVEVIRYK